MNFFNINLFDNLNFYANLIDLLFITFIIIWGIFVICFICVLVVIILLYICLIIYKIKDKYFKK